MTRILLLAALAAAAIAACSSPVITSDPSGPCAADGRAAGMYPELEVLLPRGIDGVAPTSVDSGRSCSTDALSVYAEHSIAEIRYAGATWSQTLQNATVIALITTPPGQPTLDQTFVQEFYEAGARASSKAENIETSRPTIGDAGEVWRLDTLNDLSLQTVVVWDDRGLIHVVIVATDVAPGASRAAHERRVEQAVTTSAASPAEE